MTAACCTGGGAWRRLARRRAGAAASILTGAVLLFLPKCPLCLAAWLTVVTGIGIPAAAAARVRWLIVVFPVAAVVLAAAPVVRRRALRRSPCAPVDPNFHAARASTSSVELCRLPQTPAGHRFAAQSANRLAARSGMGDRIPRRCQ